MSTAHVNTYVRDRIPAPQDQPVFGPESVMDAVPDSFNASSLLDRAIANGHGERPALRTSAGDITYRDFLARVEIVADLLVHEYGLKPGDPVLLQSPNTVMAYAAWWAVLRAGGVVVCIMHMLRAEEIVAIAAKAEIQLAIADNSLVDRVSEARSLTGLSFAIAGINAEGGLDGAVKRAGQRRFAPVATHRDDPALVAFTSGTTGEPKGCIQYHRDILLICESFLKHILSPGAEDVFCCTAPMAFTFGLGASVIFPVATGACSVLPDKPGYEALADAIDAAGVTYLFTAPTAYRVLSRMAGGRFASLTTCVSAGEHLSLETFRMWEAATGLRLVDGIGSTEMMHIFISTRPEEVRPGATGKAVPGYTAEVLGEDFQPVPPGEIGRLAVRGVTGCRYLDDPRQGVYVQQGWNLTGDLFRRDAEGYFWFVSRADDLIVSSGYNIAAVEVEHAVAQHSLVREVAVIGVPDPERGQICKAYVVIADTAEAGDALAADIQAFVKATIAPYKYPRAVEFVDALPKTHTGKLMRSSLKTQTSPQNTAP